ncbi:hypothetical protein DOCECA_12740 [Pseudomonas sp. E102]
MKALAWIFASAMLITILAYTVVQERSKACSVTQISQVLR